MTFNGRAIVEVLQRHRVEYVVIGGFAAAAQGSPLLTNDIDVTPKRERGNLTRRGAPGCRGAPPGRAPALWLMDSGVLQPPRPSAKGRGAASLPDDEQAGHGQGVVLSRSGR
jgi:hypothetical protein